MIIRVLLFVTTNSTLSSLLVLASSVSPSGDAPLQQPVQQCIPSVAQARRSFRKGSEGFLVVAGATNACAADLLAPQYELGQADLQSDIDSEALASEVADVLPSEIPPDQGICNAIPLPDAELPFRRMYRLFPADLAVTVTELPLNSFNRDSLNLLPLHLVLLLINILLS